MLIISSVFRICIFLRSYSFDIETTRVNTLSYFSRKPYPIPDQNGQSLFPFSVKNSTKYLILWDGTYLYGLGE